MMALNETIKLIIAIIITVLPLIGIWYLGVILRKAIIKKQLSKFPDTTPEAAHKHAQRWLIFIILSVILIFIAAGLILNSNWFVKKSSNVIRKIDMHEHFRAGGDARYFLLAMAAAHIEKMVLVPTDWPPSNPKYKENLTAALDAKKKYPDKFLVFATAWNKDPEAAAIIEQALKDGADGIKFIDWLSSSKYPDDAGPVDSPNMYKVYEVARKYQVPVLLHIDYQKKPEWKTQFERVAQDFPDVKFILAHYCRAASGKSTKLSLCAQTLDKFPNVYTDISMGGGLRRYMKYFDKNPRAFRNFIIKYQDRILWGADVIIDGRPYKDEEKNSAWIFKRMLTDFSMFKNLRYRTFTDAHDQKIHQGLALPDEVLQKIYWENPKKILKL